MQSEESIVNVSRITERSPSELKQVVVANLRKLKEHRAKALSELERAYVFRIEAEQPGSRRRPSKKHREHGDRADSISRAG